jgi:hypothetical protein
MIGTEMIRETSVIFNQLTLLIARYYTPLAFQHYNTGFRLILIKIGGTVMFSVVIYVPLNP